MTQYQRDSKVKLMCSYCSFYSSYIVCSFLMGLISLTQMFLNEIQITNENRKIAGCICFAIVLSNALFFGGDFRSFVIFHQVITINTTVHNDVAELLFNVPLIQHYTLLIFTILTSPMRLMFFLISDRHFFHYKVYQISLILHSYLGVHSYLPKSKFCNMTQLT